MTRILMIVYGITAEQAAARAPAAPFAVTSVPPLTEPPSP